jgi:type I restriction enzyme S subunit
MTPQELKNSIIQIAMRGRLVEQRSNEGSATELYKRIIAEKKAAGVKPNKKLEPVTEDVIPFEIPDSWMWVRFGDIVSYRMGKTPPREDLKWWNSDVPWVSISDMPEDGHIASTKESVSSFAIKEKFSDCVSPAGTMIMSFKLTVGRVSILDIDAVHNEAIISIFPYADEDNTIQSYLFRLLPTVTQYGDTKNAIKGITLNSTSICNLLIPLPPLSEQKRIVAKIEELLPLVERYGEAWTKLEEFNRKFPDDMKKSILQQAIQGKLVEQRPEEGTGEELYQRIQAEKQKFIKDGKLKKEKPLPEITEDEIPFEIPESWKWVHLSDLGEIVGGGTPKTGDPSLWDDDGIPWLTPADMKNIRGMYASHGERNISQTGLAKSSAQLMPKGTVLYSSRAPIGYIAIAANDICTNQGFKSLVPANTEINKYMYYCLIARTDDIKARASGTTFKEISGAGFGATLVPLPPLGEQKRIVAKIEEILPLCEKLK